MEKRLRKLLAQCTFMAEHHSLQWYDRSIMARYVFELDELLSDIGEVNPERVQEMTDVTREIRNKLKELL